ncbi:MAG: glutamine synthetase family protein [Pseudomonadota bacterium]
MAAKSTGGALGTGAIADALAAMPDVQTLELVFADMNGVARGKHLPVDQAEKLAGKLRMPASLFNLDIFSADVDSAGIAIARGDPDAACHAVRLGPAAWSNGRRAVALMTMCAPDGSPSPYDPRAALAAVSDRLAARGLTPVIAPELEFYIVDAARDAQGRAQPPRCPLSGERLSGAQIYRLGVQNPFSALLDAMIAAARALGCNADVALAEYGAGQFEINLAHTTGALEAADQALLLKLAIRETARILGFDASFMAKTYGDMAGSGLHFHVSLLNEAGDNVFSGATEDLPNAALRGALGGLIAQMPASVLGLAPHLNSYRRLGPGTYAPSQAVWGLDNRTTALRVPTTIGPAARFEHRLAGADANPYIALALILQAMLEGIETQADPGQPVTGEAGFDRGLLPPMPLPLGWGRALAAFRESAFPARALGAEFVRCYGLMKEQELGRLNQHVSAIEYALYMRSV